MKKILLITALTFCAVGTANASQMIVQLKSGNSVVINYSGTIESVTLEGDSDAIVGMKMQVANRQSLQQKTSNETAPETSKTLPTEQTEVIDEKNEKGGNTKVKVKWARPIDDENLKNARSDSRETRWFQ